MQKILCECIQKVLNPEVAVAKSCERSLKGELPSLNDISKYLPVRITWYKYWCWFLLLLLFLLCNNKNKKIH